MCRFVAGLVLAGLLVACGQPQEIAVDTEESAGGYAVDRAVSGEAAPAPPAAPPPPPAPTDADERGRQQQTPTTQPGQPSQPAGPTPILYLAYSYGVGLELPSQRLSGVMDRHVQACQSAGPRVCQLIGSNRQGDPDSYMQGYVSLRAEPGWLRTFMAGLENQADEAGGRIVSQTVQSEDLTRQIVDTEARLRALTALRDRLEALLRSRPGRLSDLLEVERELARVQGEIDATQSNLVVMRTRVAMSELTLNYQSSPRPVGSDTLEPLRNAFADFLGIIVGGFAAIIYVIAALIPLAIVVVPLVWLALRWRRRRGGRFFGRPPAEAPPPT
jgi:hypothetical protein